MKIYPLSFLLPICWLSVDFTKAQTSTYTIQEELGDSKNLDINTYVLYPVSRVKNELDAVLYPNPVDDLLNVKISGAKGEKISYTLFDMSGKLISAKDEKNSSFIINMGSVLSGAYLLVIADEASKKSFKIIKK